MDYSGRRLVPYIPPAEYDKVAQEFLETYYPQALTNPMPVPIEDIAKNVMGLDVQYDVVSYENAGSDTYDRFIEVKCYIGSPHFFWSENESDVAKLKGDKYILCLVDYTRMNEPGYLPEYIRDPYTHIFEGEQWMVNTASYRIQKI